MFYKAVVQAVLLFGSETWCLTPTARKRLEGFQVRASYRMAKENIPRKNPNGTWTYPSTADVLEECGLHSMEHYIEVCRKTIARFVVDRPISGLCREGGQRRGSSDRLWWWEQELGLNDDDAHLG
jgi:hypothetical protein